MTTVLDAPPPPHARSPAETLAWLGSGPLGLSSDEAATRLVRVGRNALPEPAATPLALVFLRQFASPLIYVLVAAALVSVLLSDFTDAGFIVAVLLLNAVIGAAQERSAERTARALRALVAARAIVVRDGEEREVAAEELVPGDVVVIEAGNRVAADARLLATNGLGVDESLLTGESAASEKHADEEVPVDAALGDRRTMVFAGTLATRGRGRAVVVATGERTEVGRIAVDVAGAEAGVPPLLSRMTAFSTRLAVAISVAVALLAAVSLARGLPLQEVFLVSVALAVAAIPEGLPVALTVALAIATSRMSRRRVIVRKLAAVEALGSCTMIASDKTGTLTLNELTVRALALPGQARWPVTGETAEPEGEVLVPPGVAPDAAHAALGRLAHAAALCNDGFLGRRDGGWASHGDAVDVALLALAHKLGVVRASVEPALPRVSAIPFEAERRFAATAHAQGDEVVVFVKGALERLLPMCERMATLEGDLPLEAAEIERAAHALADDGHRVIAVAAGPAWLAPGEPLEERHLGRLTLLGVVGMIDPPRADARAAIEACRGAGIAVCMVTGDHPRTATAIARELAIIAPDDGPERTVTGPQLAALAADPAAQASAIARARVLARVEPRQKLEIVQALQRAGHFVAVTGDGANDAAALRAANVGVAMGRRGTDVARESADLVLADDRFASIAAGVHDGRVAYANVRKVIFLLVSTGAAEVALFALAILLGLPMPLLAVQLLWLNLVTNGLQHIGLAAEPGEGDEMSRPPRAPTEPIFDRLMIERVTLTGVTGGGLAAGAFAWMLDNGWSLEAARNGVLLFLVLFENVQVGNARSERRSAFAISPLTNPLLLLGALGAVLLHLVGMWAPGLSTVLGASPVSLAEWAGLLGLSLVVVAVVEAHKRIR